MTTTGLYEQIEELANRVDELEAELAKFGWEPAERAPLAHGTMEAAMIGWRTRCLKAEAKLEKALKELAAVRQEVIDLGGSAVGRK